MKHTVSIEIGLLRLRAIVPKIVPTLEIEVSKCADFQLLYNYYITNNDRNIIVKFLSHFQNNLANMKPNMNLTSLVPWISSYSLRSKERLKTI